MASSGRPPLGQFWNCVMPKHAKAYSCAGLPTKAGRGPVARVSPPFPFCGGIFDERVHMGDVASWLLVRFRFAFGGVNSRGRRLHDAQTPASRTGVSNLRTAQELLTPRYHLRWSPTVHIGLIEYCVRAHVRWPGGQHLLLTVNQIARAKRRQLKAVPMCNRIGRASLHTIPAKDTSVVVDVVDLRVSFGATDATFGGVFGGFDVDTIRRAGGGTEEAGDTFFQPVFIALQDLGSAESGFDARPSERALACGLLLHGGGLEHLHEGDAHAFGDGRDVLQDRHARLGYRIAGKGTHRCLKTPPPINPPTPHPSSPPAVPAT